MYVDKCIVCLCVLWPRDIYVHECMFLCTCTDTYIHRCNVCDESCVCVHVSDCRHMCGDVFVRVFYLSVCRRESSDLCSEPSIYMYTVPSSGHEKKASQTKQKKGGGWLGRSRIQITSYSRLVHGHKQGKVSRMDLERAGKASHPLHRGLCAGSRPQCAGPASQCRCERAHSLAWRQDH